MSEPRCGRRTTRGTACTSPVAADGLACVFHRNSEPPMLAVLVSPTSVPTPDFADAACIGRWTLFDEAAADEDAESVAERHAAALALCSQCPVLAECMTWAYGLTQRQRPPGVLAGELPAQRSARGRPRKDDE